MPLWHASDIALAMPRLSLHITYSWSRGLGLTSAGCWRAELA